MKEKDRSQAFLWKQLHMEPEYHKVIAVVGAGGKTSLIYALAEELRRSGYQVIVTTTTHMLQPEENYIAGIHEDKLCRMLEEHGTAVVGIPCGDGKIKGLPREQSERLKQYCDVMLVEADGAHGKAMKVPAAYEPVLPDGTDMVVGILGASAVGRTLREACHRYERAAEILGVPVDETGTHVVTVQELEYLLRSEQGQKKGVTLLGAAYRAVIGQADYLEEGRVLSPDIIPLTLEHQGNLQREL